MALARIAFWLAMVAWVGAVVFFSTVVTPTVFASLPRERAGEVVSALFPRYYALGGAAGAVAVLAAVWMWRGTAPARTWAVVTALAATMLLATLWAGVVVQPRAHALRPAVQDPASAPELRAEFTRLHRLAVTLNGVVLVLGLAGVVIAAMAPPRP